MHAAHCIKSLINPEGISKLMGLPWGRVLGFLALGLLGEVSSGAQSAWASDLRPTWASEGRTSAMSQLNASFFIPGVKSVNQVEEEAFQDFIFERQMSSHMRQRYEDLYREFELQEKYDLVDADERRLQHQRNRDFGRFYLRSLFSFHVTEGIKRAEKNSEEMRTFKRVHDKVEHVMRQGVQLDISERFKVGSRADIPRQRARVWMISPVVNGAFEMAVGSAQAGDPTAKALDPSRRDERYRLSLTRQVPVLNLDSAVTYGSSSSSVTASLSKQFSNNLTCVLDRSQPMPSTRSELRVAEQSAKVVYRLEF